MNEDQEIRLRPDASELIESTPEVTCDTFIFAPSPTEQKLGWLYLAAETEKRGGIGEELLPMVAETLQKEYYRDSRRGILTSFESALHQANLVLHDAASQGVRDWMGHFHAALAILSQDTLHISTAGDGAVWLVRKQSALEVSTDLSYSPITDPLKTFSQVASGQVAPRDTIFLGTHMFSTLYRTEDLIRFSHDHAADNISTRLQQLYEDKHVNEGLSAITISILPEHVTNTSLKKAAPLPTKRREQVSHDLSPRRPMKIHRSTLQSIIAITIRAALSTGRALKKYVSRLFSTGIATSQQSFASIKNRSAKQDHRTTPKQSVKNRLTNTFKSTGSTIAVFFRRLPLTSKVFAVISLVLAVVLVVSLVLLHQKRVADEQIQQASENLHSAQTKLTAAENALIYDNREQARTLTEEAQVIATELSAQGLYQDEVQELNHKISVVTDKLQRVVRASSTETTVVGDFGDLLPANANTSLAVIDDSVFAYKPSTNEIVQMELSSGATSIASSTTEGIGFLKQSIVQPADKTITYLTDSPGIALFEATDNTLRRQNISFSSAQPDIADITTYGNRLYVIDRTANNIFSYNKSLRGFEGGAAWLNDQSITASTMNSLAIDGNIYTLQNDGTVAKFFKGERTDFNLEAVTPALSGSSQLHTREDFQFLYVLDLDNKRVVVYQKDGTLIKQVFIDVSQRLGTLTILNDESAVIALDGTRVLTIPLK